MGNEIKKKKILLVEDEAIIALSQKKALEYYGYIVLTTYTGKDAIDIFSKNKDIDLILMDIDLGKGIDSGSTATAILEERTIPIVFLSSHTESEMVKKTENITSYGYVVKDSGITVLDASIKMAFRLFEANKKVQDLKDKLEATLEALPDQLFEVGLDGTFYDYHSPRTELLNFTDIIGKNIKDILPQDITEIVMSAVLEASENGFSTAKQYQLTVPAGKLWFEISVSRKGTASGKPHFIILRRDITSRKLADEKHFNISHLYALLSQVNHAIIWTREQDDLFSKICRVAIEFGRFRMAWIGIVDHTAGIVKPVAWAGHEDGYLDQINILIKDTSAGAGPAGSALREGNISICYDISSDPGMLPWRTEALKRGYLSSAALPFRCEGKLFGILNLYAPETGFFTEDEQRLLHNIGENISFALDAMASEYERKRAESALRESEQIISTMFAQATESIVLIDTKSGNFVDFNESAHSGLGYTREEFSVMSVSDLQGEYTNDQLALNSENAAGRMSIGFETFHRHKNGTLRDVTVTLKPINQGGRSLVSAVWRDITDQKRKEKELKKINEELDLLISSLSSIIIGVSIKDQITHWNPFAEQVFGIKSADILGKQFYETEIDWNWQVIYEGISDCILDDTTVRIDDLRFSGHDNKKGILGLTINPLKRGGDTLEGFIILGKDMTEQKILESQLLQSNKLEAIGQLAAGVAHEINTPMQYVGDNLKFLNKSFIGLINLLDIYEQAYRMNDNPPEFHIIASQAGDMSKKIKLPFLLEQMPRALEQSLEGIARISAIVQSMKAFSHPGTGHKMPADINKAIKNTVTVSRNEWKYDCELQLDLDPSLPAVPCFESELNQVILNLIVNAKDAILDAKNKNKAETGLINIQTRHDSSYAIIKVEDNGAGIPEEIRNRIFDPFFTTKEVGKGTGQGLPISYSIIVEKHGGLLYFETEAGKGTAFFIKLPVAEKDN